MTTDPTRLSRNEMMVLQMLVASGREQYAYGMADDSEGQLKRAGIYTMLNRMEDKGFIKSRKEEVREGARGKPRRLYKITGIGQRSLAANEMAQAAFANKCGLV